MNQKKQELKDCIHIVERISNAMLKGQPALAVKVLQDFLSQTRQEAVEERDKQWIEVIKKYEELNDDDGEFWKEYYESVKALSLKKEL